VRDAELKGLAAGFLRTAQALNSTIFRPPGEDDDAKHHPAAERETSTGQIDAQLLATAKALYAQRRRRDQTFGAHAGLFGEPAWDILLDLYITQGQGRLISVTDSTLASQAPATTGLRYLASLADVDLVERVADPTDGRRQFLRLTETGLELMKAHLSQIETVQAT
jgi:DNA-binding MarR family transcriptional regulator